MDEFEQQVIRTMAYTYVRERKNGYSVIYPSDHFEGRDSVWINYISTDKTLTVINKNTQESITFNIDKRFHNATMISDITGYMGFLGLNPEFIYLKSYADKEFMKGEVAKDYLNCDEELLVFSRYIVKKMDWSKIPQEYKPFVLFLENFCAKKGTIDLIKDVIED